MRLPYLLPSPLQEVPIRVLNDAGVTLLVKRDDLIHPMVSGNKWRKLRLNIEKATQLGHDTILTFGGAHSNHLVATAVAGAAAGLRTVGVVRGEDARMDNPTLSAALRAGMRLYPVSREEYALAVEYSYVKSLEHTFGPFFHLPQGGANYYGVQGCMDVINELNTLPHKLFTACGTGTTLSGLLLGAKGRFTCIGVPVLKGGTFIATDVAKNLYTVLGDEDTVQWMIGHMQLLIDFHFGGYAKTTPELIAFMRDFTRETNIRLDPVYTAKAAYAMLHLAKAAPPTEPETWVLLHTGGLQGITAMEQKLGYRIYPQL
jgi:1-aminocyclopropane-1-carboxylate deaminase/D-cysteine desulfhydrase-like pyridoxal-dependent ACC family enzyme